MKSTDNQPRKLRLRVAVLLLGAFALLGSSGCYYSGYGGGYGHSHHSYGGYSGGGGGYGYGRGGGYRGGGGYGGGYCPSY